MILHPQPWFYNVCISVIVKVLNICAICILQKTLKIFWSYCFAFMLSPAFSSHRECPLPTFPGGRDLGLYNTWMSHIAYKSVIPLLGQSLRTSKYSPVPGAWQRFLAILSLVLCYAVHLGSTENINKRSPGAPASYYFCQNKILYSERVNGL